MGNISRIKSKELLRTVTPMAVAEVEDDRVGVVSRDGSLSDTSLKVRAHQ
jgi:hypothetical protein